MSITADLQYSVRPRRTSDLSNLQDVLSRVYEVDSYPLEGPSPRILEPPDTLTAFAALLDDHVVGQIVLTSPSHSLGAVAAWAAQGNEINGVAVLGRLFVDPAARGRGIGKALVEMATGWAEENERRLLLDVIEKDVAAIKLYEKLGWTRFGQGGEYKYGGREWRVIFFAAPWRGLQAE